MGAQQAHEAGHGSESLLDFKEALEQQLEVLSGCLSQTSAEKDLLDLRLRPLGPDSQRRRPAGKRSSERASRQSSERAKASEKSSLADPPPYESSGYSERCNLSERTTASARGKCGTRSRYSERGKTSQRSEALSRRTVLRGTARSDSRTRTFSTRASSNHEPRMCATRNGALRYLEPVPDAERIIVIGDLHGMLHKAKALWHSLEYQIGADKVMKALVVFLGDYCDRGLYTKELLQWLIALKKHREENGARTVFLLGNHEFCLLSFLGRLPRPLSRPDFRFSETWSDGQITSRNERERWWGHREQDAVLDQMHLQGRRWAGPMYERSYGSTATFVSYGTSRGDRIGLERSMPEEHIQFLQECSWVHVEDSSLLGRCIFVHAGLESDGTVDAQEQLNRLSSREVAAESQPEQLFGRDGVLHAPPLLVRNGTTVISGHHGRVLLRTHRIILDSCAGDECKLLSALVLPETILVQQDGTLEPRDPCSVFPKRQRLPPGAICPDVERMHRSSVGGRQARQMPTGDDFPFD